MVSRWKPTDDDCLRAVLGAVQAHKPIDAPHRSGAARWDRVKEDANRAGWSFTIDRLRRFINNEIAAAEENIAEAARTTGQPDRDLRAWYFDLLGGIQQGIEVR